MTNETNNQNEVMRFEMEGSLPEDYKQIELDAYEFSMMLLAEDSSSYGGDTINLITHLPINHTVKVSI